METTEFIPPPVIEYLAVLLWATSGAIVGWRKGYDNVGVFVVAAVSSFGGGILRDGLFLQRVPPLLTESIYLPLVFAATAIVILVGRLIQRDRYLPKVVAVIDALGTPMFAVLGVELALYAGLPTLSVLFVGVVSGVGGGLLRDVMVGDTPELLRPGQYNTLLVVVACGIYVALSRTTDLTEWESAWIVISLFFIARLLTIRFNWRSRPVNEFEIRHVVEGVMGLVPIWNKEDKTDKSRTEEGGETADNG
jgi:uncharacterized membrane protein YeiH